MNNTIRIIFTFFAFVCLMPLESMAQRQCYTLFGLTKSGAQTFLNSKKESIAFRIEGNISSKKVYLFLSGLDKNMSEWDRLLKLMMPKDPQAAYVRIDLFGQGETAEMNPTSESTIHFSRQVELLQDFIQSQGLSGKEINFISHSYGGAIASRYVQENPDAIRRNILLAPFVDNLEIHQPGVGPFLAWSKFVSEISGLKALYEFNTQTSGTIGTTLTWPAYKLFHKTDNRLRDVLALTNGVRDVGMSNALRHAGSTETSVIVSSLDELIPITGHLFLWKDIPEESQGFFLNVIATHEAVSLNPDQVFEQISKVIPEFQ